MRSVLKPVNTLVNAQLRSRLAPPMFARAAAMNFSVVPFKLADIGEGIAEVELLKWFVKDGEKVKSFDKICEVQSDKATVEITSRFDGKIVKLHHAEGSIVKVGSALLDIDTDASGAVAPVAPPKKAAPAPTPAAAAPVASSAAGVVPFKLADIGEGIAEVELLKWFVKEGETVKSFDKICEVQSDKATVEITSRFDGKIVKLHHDIGSVVKVGSALLDIATGAASAAPVVTAASPAAVAKASGAIPTGTGHAGPSHKVLTTPSVRKIAKENKIDLTLVRATGPKGRILKEDVLNYLKNGRQSAAPAPPVATSSSAAVVNEPVSSPATTTTSSPADVKVPIRGVQRLMVKSMTAANQVKHLTLGEEVTFDKMRVLRHQLKHAMSKQGVKLSYMPLIIKATSLALLQYPMLNATVNSEVTEVTHHHNHNIGIAMDTPKGLIVPVIKAVQDKSIAQIAVELNQLQDAAAKGTITEAQLSGGTFSLSNIGSVGGTYAVPVLVVPQVAIGALGRLQVVPRYINKHGQPAKLEEIEDGEAQVAPTTIMNVSWSADHRVVDGATVAKFSNAWKHYIEHPEQMLAQLR